MGEIIELLSYSFIQRALISGIAISFCAALIGVILVLKRYSMIGHGLGEVAFAALSLALVLNLPEMYIAIPIVVIASFIILIVCVIAFLLKYESNIIDPIKDIKEILFTQRKNNENTIYF